MKVKEIGAKQECLSEEELYDKFIEETADEDGEVDNNYFKYWLADLIAAGRYELVEE